MIRTTIGTLRRTIRLIIESNLYNLGGISFGWLDPMGKMHEMQRDEFHNYWAQQNIQLVDHDFTGKIDLDKANDKFLEAGWIAVSNISAMTTWSGPDHFTDAQRNTLIDFAIRAAKKGVDPSHTVFVGNISKNFAEKIELGDFVRKLGGRKAENEFFDALI